MKRIRIIIEDCPKKPKKKKKSIALKKVKLSKYKKIYNEGVILYNKLCNDNNLSSLRGVDNRTEYVSNLEAYNRIIDITKTLYKYELRCKKTFVLTTFLTIILSFFLAYYLKISYNIPLNILIILNFIFIVCSCLFLLLLSKPCVSVKEFYNNIFLGICRLCAGNDSVKNFASFKPRDKAKENNKLGTPIVTNNYRMTNKDYQAEISRIALQDSIRHIVNDSGNVKFVKKTVTVFTGYRMNFKRVSKKNVDSGKLLFAVCKSDVFFENTIVSNALARGELVSIPREFHLVNQFNETWQLYCAPEIVKNKILLKQFIKKIVECKNNLKSFDMIFFDNEIKLYIDIRNNSEGLFNEFICSEFKNGKRVNKSGFIANARVIYAFTLFTKLASKVWN